MPGIRSIDLSSFLQGTAAEQQAIAADVDEICQTLGFLVIEQHGVAQEIVDAAWTSARAFFDLPLEQKMLSKAADAGCPRGYFPFESEALAKSLGVDTPPDIKESLGIGPLRAPDREMSAHDFEFHYGENLWPAQPADLQDALTSYMVAMESLGNDVLKLFAAALSLPHDYFAASHTDPMCALRCLNYPAADQPLLPQQRGAGEHADYGSITMLKSDPQVSGLEVRLPSGEWIAAPLVEDGFIVNIGDMMARWTNDRWISTMHRVISPGTPGGGSGRRQSLAYFYNTSFDAQISCIPTCLADGEQPKYESVNGGDYLMRRFSSALELPRR
jgi:isopenicillin N synthase-like dioxygenase